MSSPAAAQLRKLLNGSGPLVVPFAYDAFSARLIEDAATRAPAAPAEGTPAGDAPGVRETSSKRSGYSVSPRSPLKDNSIGSVHEVYELTGLILSCGAVAG